MSNDFHNTTHVESRSRAELRNFIIQSSTLLEISLSGLVLIGLLISIVPLIQWMPGLFIDGNDVEIRTFLERALDIVIGIEFIKMLAKHSPGSSLEVLLYAIARHMVIGHESAFENLLSVAAIAPDLRRAQVLLCTGLWCPPARRPPGPPTFPPTRAASRLPSSKSGCASASTPRMLSPRPKRTILSMPLKRTSSCRNPPEP